MSRRLRLFTEYEATGLVDDARLSQFLDGEKITDRRLVGQLSDRIEGGETTVAELLESLCGLDFDPHVSASCLVEIEEQCPKHPGVWLRVSPRQKCQECYTERLDSQDAKRRERAAA